MPFRAALASAGGRTVAINSIVSSRIIFAMNVVSSRLIGMGFSGVGWPASIVNSRTASASERCADSSTVSVEP